MTDTFDIRISDASRLVLLDVLNSALLSMSPVPSAPSMDFSEFWLHADSARRVRDLFISGRRGPFLEVRLSNEMRLVLVSALRLWLPSGDSPLDSLLEAGLLEGMLMSAESGGVLNLFDS